MFSIAGSSLSDSVNGGVFVPMASWLTVTSVKALNADRHMRVLEPHVLPSRCPFQRRPRLFQQDNPKTCSAYVPTACAVYKSP